MQVVGHFVCRERATNAEQALSQSRLSGANWRIREGFLPDDGIKGMPAQAQQETPVSDTWGQPPCCQPLSLIVQVTDQEMAEEVAALLCRHRAADVATQ
ncbi:MAG TPA: hypothetical protein VK464_13130 [Symbiobacteriaceae bacterium]|jgi:hypothetical protein|nr:hypothetical protein [Symbiobacteriaceae bacterium]